MAEVFVSRFAFLVLNPFGLSLIGIHRSASTPARAGRAGTGGTRDPTATPSQTARGPRSEDGRGPSRERTSKASPTLRSGGRYCNDAFVFLKKKPHPLFNTFVNPSQVRQELQKIWGTAGKVKLHRFLSFFFCSSTTTWRASLLNASLVLQAGRHRSRRRAGG